MPLRNGAKARLEPATYKLQVRCHTDSTTTPPDSFFIGLAAVSCVLICLVTLGIVLGLVDFRFLLFILSVLLILSS